MKTYIFVVISLIYCLNFNMLHGETNDDNFQTRRSNNLKSVLLTENWLKDPTTIPFDDPAKRAYFRNSFNGIRLLFEPQFGHVLQTVDNRVETRDFNGLLKFGFETNLIMGYVSLQGMIIFPATVQLDTLSFIRANQHVIDPSGRVNVDYGLVIGLSFFDGLIAIGYGGLFYDKRGFKNMDNIHREEFDYQSNFVYFAIQPVSAIKTVIQSIKSE